MKTNVFFCYNIVFKLATKQEKCDNLIKQMKQSTFLCFCCVFQVYKYIQDSSVVQCFTLLLHTQKVAGSILTGGFSLSVCNFSRSPQTFSVPQLYVFACLLVSFFFLATFQGCNPALSELCIDSNTGSDRKYMAANFILHPFEHRVLTHVVMKLFVDVFF